MNYSENIIEILADTAAKRTTSITDSDQLILNLCQDILELHRMLGTLQSQFNLAQAEHVEELSALVLAAGGDVDVHNDVRMDAQNFALVYDYNETMAKHRYHVTRHEFENVFNEAMSDPATDPKENTNGI